MKEDRKAIDRWIPWMFVLFFAVIAVADGIMVTIALKTHTGTVLENAYEEGLAYNNVLAANEVQQSMGWKSVTAFENGRLSFSLEDKHGQPVSGARARAHIVRPVQEGYDFDIVLKEKEKGLYVAEAHFPLKGEWETRIFVQWQDRHYQSGKTLVID